MDDDHLAARLAIQAEMLTLQEKLAQSRVNCVELGNAWETMRRERDEARQERDRLRERCETLANNHEHRVEELAALREQLAATHSECPDCADYAARSGRFAAQADKLQRERDEARNALFRADQDALRVEEERDQLRAELRMVREGCDGWLERCEQLSRERDNWKQSSDERNDECNRIQRTLNVCADERDEARAEAERLRHELNETVKSYARANDAWWNCVGAMKERDEARAELHASNEQMDFIAKALQLEHDDDIEDAVTDMVAEMEHARDRIEELRAEVERLREDDKAGLRRERDEACEMVTRIEQEAYRIKLEARAEVATAAKYCDELAETIRMHVAREIELEAEVERLREGFRRGAEAMRKQVMSWLVRAQAEATVIVVDTAIRSVDKLPEPEER